MPYGFGGANIFAIVILILIVLQWFRVVTNGAGAGGISRETGLLNGGGLFIIAIFLLIACGHPPAIYNMKRISDFISSLI